MPSSSIQLILDAAFAEYAKQIGIDPAKHPFADQLQTCHSPDDVLKLLEVKANEFKDYRDGNRKLIDCLKPVVNVIHVFSDVIGEVVSMVPFQPAKAIFVGVNVLLAAASGVSSSYDALVELFECVGGFLKRLRIYTDLPLTPLMMEISVKIMVDLLSVLALATKQIKQGRFKKFAKKLLGESEIEAVLQRLDRLTQEEGRMTLAQTLEVVHGLMNAMKVVMNDGKASMVGIWKALDAMQEMAGEINKIRRDQLKEKSRSWLSPPDPSPNYNSGCEIHQDGTATWFLQGSLFNLWNEKGSLLWIYGKPGSGKSILMSSIIREIGCKCKAGLASMAYFYFDFRDTQKQHRRGLLSSLLLQLSAKSDSCYHIFSRLYFDHDEGTRQPSDDTLFECLTEMLNVQGQPATYLIVDALDECPNISGMPTAREKVLEFLEDLVGLSLPNVHICVSSRPEFDIQTSLEPLASFRMLLDDESGQKADISGYINSVVHSDRRIRRWSGENKQLVVDTLSDKADGMFRWVSCQLEILRRCFPSSIRDTLESLPKTLDATYEHTLLGIDEEKWRFAHRLFQCLAVSVRPLRVEELAEVLAVRFDPGALPRFHTGWRLGDAEEAVLSACSSLITVVNVHGFRVVQFAHFSVKEFLTSDRLASTAENFSRYHIVPHFAHSTLAQAALGVLLELDDRIDKESIRNYPLADYAARYWLDHCQFGSVTMAIQGATKLLFNRARPHFSSWIWIYDIDDPWRNSFPTKHPEQPEATPLYYGIMCGFPWLIEHLIAIYPADVNARGGYYGTPLLATIRKEDVNVTSSSRLPHGASVHDMVNGGTSLLDRTSHGGRVDTVRLLLEHNADVNLPNEVGDAPLYWASAVGILEIVRLLVEWGADVRPQNRYDRTPVKMASHYGHVDVIRFLIDTGAEIDSPDNEGWTPLHSASRQGQVNIVELLLEHGVAINQQNHKKETPLHLACQNGKLEISHLLVERGADVHSRSEDDWTPLQMASHKGHLNVVQFLIDCGSDVDSHNNQGWTSLHSAAQEGYVSVVESLIEHGADIHKRSHTQVTPLDKASASGKLEIVQLFVEHGADVHSQTEDLWTPLKTASHNGHPDVVLFLINSGAEVDAYDNQGWTPLHSASRQGHVKIVESLIQAGADVNQQNYKQETPLDLASASGELEISRLLVLQGASLQCRDKDGWTPLKTASHYGHLDVVQFLIDSGANLNSHDNQGWTPLHAAVSEGHPDVVELLLARGADSSIRDDRDRTPFELISDDGNPGVGDFLSEQVADSVSPVVDDAANAIPSTISLRNAPPTIVNPPPSEWEDETPSDNGQFLVYAAARDGQLDTVRSLLDRGYDVNDMNTCRETALDVASSLGNFEVARLLIERGADVDPRDRDGWTPLITALECGQLEVMRLLLAYGADVNTRRRDGKTPLHCASFNGQFEMVKLLLERGANVDDRNRDGQTPMQIAIQQGNRRVVELLQEREQGVTIQTRSTPTPH